jgi:glycerophosphoryl diester phosphodiesterase
MFHLRTAGATALGALGGALLGLSVPARRRGRWPGHPALARLPLVIGHRGAAGLFPENTIAGFRGALGAGLVDALEFDVRATADGHCVLLHDETVDRTTDGVGAVASLTLAEARALDAGYRFSLDGGTTFPFRGQGIRIPTIREALEVVRGWPVIIELKTAAAQPELLDELQRLDAGGWAVVAGERDEFRTSIGRHQGPISGSAQQLERWYRLHLLGLGAFFRPAFDVANVPEYWQRRRVVTPRFIRGLHRHGIAVHIWTVNDADDMRRLLGWGVDGIITDRPDTMRSVLTGPPASPS